jgi:SAM-dependent methyltransferase
VADAHDPGAYPPSSFDAATFVLSLQHMEGPETVLRNAAGALRPGGRLVLALHHPAFRIPGSASWGWDPDREIQFRRVDRYRSSHRVEVPPSDDRGEPPFPSFHWSLERLFGALRGAGFVVIDLAEPAGDRPPESGKESAETRARREIPLFLILLARRGGGRSGHARRGPA